VSDEKENVDVSPKPAVSVSKKRSLPFNGNDSNAIAEPNSQKLLI